MKKDTYRVVTRGADGQLAVKDYDNKEELLKLHTQIGVDDCSTDLDLRGMPVFRGLIGPMAEDKTVVRYETPDVFEALTKEWVAQPAEKKRRRRRSKAQIAADTAAEASAAATAAEASAAATGEVPNPVGENPTVELAPAATITDPASPTVVPDSNLKLDALNSSDATPSELV